MGSRLKLVHSQADTRPMLYARREFSRWCREESYSPRTTDLYVQYVARAAASLQGTGTTIRGATISQLREWWASLPCSASSRNGARHALMAFYRFRGRPDGAPAHLLPRVPAPLTLPRPIDAETFAQIRTAAVGLGGPHEVVGALLGFTGARIGEVTRARWTQLELRGDDPAWWIEGKGSRRRGPKIRRVPLHPDAVAALTRWRASTRSADWVFASSRSRSGHLSTSTVSQYVTEICEAAATDRATAHRWRHSVATHGLAMTGDLRGIQELLGHASLATTQIYTGILPGRLRTIVDALGSPSPTAA